MSIAVVWIVGGAFAIAMIATGLMLRYALQRRLIDVPNPRSSHSSPTPRGGGMAIVVAFLGAVLALAFTKHLDGKIALALAGGGGVIALIGFLDDRRTLSAGARFAVHVAAAALVVAVLGGIPGPELANWGLHGVWLGATIAVLVLVWTTNLFNFMDGIDGIAGGEAVFIAGAGAWINWRHGGDAGLTVAMLSLGAATSGFLRWNWPPARIFMGDVGSGFVGFSLAVLGLAASTEGAIPIGAWAILGGAFLVDATVTLLRRIARGDRWMEAHRLHAYQHLARRYRAHLPVTGLVILINVVWLLPWAIIAVKFPMRAPLFFAAALAPLIVLALACGAGAEER